MSEYVAEPQLPLDIPLATSPRNGRSTTLSYGGSSLDCARARLVAIAAAFAGLFLITSLRLVDATLLQQATAAELAGPTAEAITAPPRADLMDRNGNLLATSIPAQSLYADPHKLEQPEQVAREISRVLPDMKYEDLLARLTSAKRFVWLKRNLSPEEVLKVNALGYPGLEFQTEQVRFYPGGASTAHLLGYSDIDNHGLAGVERGLDKQLAAGGGPVALSLDMRLQHIVRREMSKAIKEYRAIGGAGLVMDIQTGEMLAAVSLPDFDPQQAATAKPEERFNRFSLGTYELGSVFKVFTIATGMEQNRFGLGTFFNAADPIKSGRFTINDFHAENRWLSAAEVFIYSSNIGAARMALDIGTPAMEDYFTRLGLTSRLNDEVAEEGRVLAPDSWKDINAMTIAYGHGISVTPLHFMRAMSAVMGDGRVIEPTFLKRDAAQYDGSPVFSSSTVDRMRRLMRANVVIGTGKSADVPGYFVGGKTGTAEKVSGKRYSTNARLSSFVAAFPMNNPRYLIYLLIDEPQPKEHGYATGGVVVAPAAGRIIAEMAPMYGLAPQSADDPAIRKALTLDVKSRKEPLETF